MRNETFERLADKATDSSSERRGTTELINEVYWLALRMLWHPEDAEQATQSIVSTVLDDLRTIPSEVPLRVYMLCAAVEYLLRARKSPYERQGWTFDALAHELDHAPEAPAPGLARERRELEQELQIGCTQAMLLCLDREQRVTYLLSAVFLLNDETAAFVVGVPTGEFRERLARARERVSTFMEGHCGLLNPVRPCRCSHRLGKALQTGRVDPERLLFVVPALSVDPPADCPRSDPARVFRDQPLKSAPPELLDRLTLRLKSKLRRRSDPPPAPESPRQSSRLAPLVASLGLVRRAHSKRSQH